MKSNQRNGILIILVLSVLVGRPSYGATTLISDDFNVTGNGTGFNLDQGVNSGINPPTTRLSGSAVDNLRYIRTETARAANAYSITGSRLQVAAAANSGRVELSADGTSPLNYAPLLGTDLATPASPRVYDITISMANSAATQQRCTFGLTTSSGSLSTWNFGLQLYRAVSGGDYYAIQERISTGASGLGDPNSVITATAPGTYGSELDFLIRVTDAGAESEANYNSRLQLSLDGGSTWFYDTSTDAYLVNGWRFDGAGRYLEFAIAGQAAPTYDNFSITLVPEPSALTIALLGAFLLWRARNGAPLGREILRLP